MKRLVFSLVVVAVVSLLVAAPASATGVLRGTWVSGVGMQIQPDGTLKSFDLAVSGSPVSIAVGPTKVGAVGGAVAIDVAPGVDPMMPFPLRMPLATFKWDPAEWGGDSYTLAGHVTRRMLPPFTAVLVATPETGELRMTITTTGSAWGWQSWELYGELQ